MTEQAYSIGIIGGTGLYKVEDLKVLKKEWVETPFGRPSAPLTMGEWMGKKVVFLPRHGEHHEILPSEINFRANLWALKSWGVRRVISVSATGSLVQEIAPGELALAHQYIDFTKGVRKASFFGNGIVGHISSAHPTCADLASELIKAASKAKIKLHKEKTYVCVEGPRLGTRAESFMLKAWGGDLVGMTNVPEVFLAREAQICYVTLAIPTDYDCWLEDPAEHVSLEQVIKRYGATLGSLLSVLRAFLDQTRPEISLTCECRKGISQAVMTSAEPIKPEQHNAFEVLKL
jgi:5'-methylthioadenosine phosphorylase